MLSQSLSLPPPLPLPRRISRAWIAETLARAEAEFRWCWRLVRVLKRPDDAGPDAGTDILRFQPRLVEAIIALEAARRAVRSELKRLKREGCRYDRRWLTNRRASLERFQQALSDTLAIGRAIGDGFAWFFYEKDRRLIGEHFKHHAQAELPVSIGGLGERMLVHGLPGFEGRLVLYHGTTTFLRLGDVSFVDLPTRRVQAIAELKTRKVSDGEYRLMLHVIADATTFAPGSLEGSTEIISFAASTEDLRDVMRERLEAQIERMSRAVAGARDGKPAKRLGQPSTFQFEALADSIRTATSGKLRLTRAGPGLLVGALRASSGRSFATDLRVRDGADRLMGDVIKQAMEIMDPERPDNALVVGSAGGGVKGLSASFAGLPPVWWPMDDAALEEVLFGKVLLVTLYNPVHLRRAMEARGLFAVEGQDVLVGTVDGRAVQLEAFSHFDRLIQSEFMSMDSVLDMIDATFAVAREKGLEGGVRMSIHAQVTTGDHAHEDDLGG